MSDMQTDSSIENLTKKNVIKCGLLPIMLKVKIRIENLLTGTIKYSRMLSGVFIHSVLLCPIIIGR